MHLFFWPISAPLLEFRSIYGHSGGPGLVACADSKESSSSTTVRGTSSAYFGTRLVLLPTPSNFEFNTPPHFMPAHEAGSIPATTPWEQAALGLAWDCSGTRKA